LLHLRAVPAPGNLLVPRTGDAVRELTGDLPRRRLVERAAQDERRIADVPQRRREVELGERQRGALERLRLGRAQQRLLAPGRYLGVGGDVILGEHAPDRDIEDQLAEQPAVSDGERCRDEAAEAVPEHRRRGRQPQGADELRDPVGVVLYLHRRGQRWRTAVARQVGDGDAEPRGERQQPAFPQRTYRRPNVPRRISARSGAVATARARRATSRWKCRSRLIHLS